MLFTFNLIYTFIHVRLTIEQSVVGLLYVTGIKIFT